MRKSNPTFILRNWIAQAAIEEAEKGNYSGVRTVLKMLTNPYDKKYSTFRNANCGKADDSENTLTSGELKYLQIPPEWADSLICTCSS